jgi:Zn-dependent protease with chaperone function
MVRKLSGIALTWTFGLLAFSAPVAHADERQDGIRVDKPSTLRRLVPSEQLEAQAAKQYGELKQMATQKNVLRSDADVQVRRLRAIAQRLIPQAARWNDRARQWQWEVSLIQSQQINAFCMPGGKIAFFSGILDTLQLTDDEVAIVMGHEMAHALREHGRERVAKGALMNFGLAIGSQIFGLHETGQIIAGQGAQLAMLKFSRNDETEADKVGLDLAARAGFDPRAGVALWEKMGRLNKRTPLKWFSSHPAGTDRIAEIRRNLPAVMPLYARSKGVAAKALPPYQGSPSTSR